MLFLNVTYLSLAGIPLILNELVSDCLVCGTMLSFLSSMYKKLQRLICNLLEVGSNGLVDIRAKALGDFVIRPWYESRLGNLDFDTQTRALMGNLVVEELNTREQRRV